MQFLGEKEFQDTIYKNKELQRDICANLDIDYNECVLDKEVRFVNGIVSDFVLFQNGKIRAIIECKGGKINVTDYVRGIGQIFQYEYFAEENLSIKDYKFYPLSDFYSVYIFPDSVLRHNDFNIGLFKYPHTKRILEINSQSLAVRLINDTELKRLKESKELNLKVISQYYIRDNRLFELYFLLKVLLLFKLKSIEVNRVALHSESGLLRQLNTINNRNWRNAFISLSSFGFIDSKNYPTQSGTILADMPFCEFALVMFESYLRPYYEAIFKVLPENVRATNKELASAIRKQFNCRTDILFLTQSNGRYVSSWLNIAKDDFGILDFESHSHDRKILLNPCSSSRESFKAHINKYSKFNYYNKKFMEVYSGI